MARLGFSYEELCKLNPKIIYCAISGFGQTGPDAFKPAYDQIIQGLSGMMAINGDERLNPLRCGFPVCDTVGGECRVCDLAARTTQHTGRSVHRHRPSGLDHAAHGLGGGPIC
jgi:crotonobetainyl-CoA:carnitine CoA-transferase CaiB-like acyl-CoA transferase